MLMPDNDLQRRPAELEAPPALVGHRGMTWLAILVFACAMQATWVGLRVLRAKSELTWDPAQHAMWGWAVWSDVASGNWLSFLYDTYRQVYWPPLHSWAMAAAMLVFGPSTFAVGLASLVAYASAGVALGVLASRAQPRYGGIAAAVTVGLWLTAGNLVHRYATVALTEMPAIAVTAGALLLLSRALERGTRSAWIWAGVGAMATYLTKTDYGIILMLATAAGVLLAARAGSQPAPLGKLVPWATAIAVLAALWFAYPAKIPATVAALVNRAQGPPTLSLAGMTYHLTQLVQQTDGFAVWGLSLLAFGATALRPRTDLLRVVTIYIVVAYLLHTLSPTKDEKHIVKVVPWLFLLTGVQAARLRAAVEASRRRGWLVAALGIALGAGALARVNELAWKAQPALPRGTDAIVEAIAARVRPGASHVMIGGFAEVSAHYVNWTVLGNNPHARVVPDPMTKTGYTREAFQEMAAGLRLRAPLLRLVEPGVEGPTFRVAHVLTRRRDQPTDAPAILERMFKLDPDRVLVLTLDPGSIWDTQDYRDFQHPGAAFVPHLRARSDLRLTEVVEFPGRGVHLFVFDRRRD
jgi:hypothetical protein